jgi:hypothetical protein
MSVDHFVAHTKKNFPHTINEIEIEFEGGEKNNNKKKKNTRTRLDRREKKRKAA